MDDTIPAAWRSLPAMRRDILVVLAVDGPAIGATINESLGRERGVNATVHKHLAELREQGLVRSEDDDSRPGRARVNSLTPAGRELVESVAAALALAVGEEGTA